MSSTANQLGGASSEGAPRGNSRDASSTEALLRAAARALASAPSNRPSLLLLEQQGLLPSAPGAIPGGGGGQQQSAALLGALRQQGGWPPTASVGQTGSSLFGGAASNPLSQLQHQNDSHHPVLQQLLALAQQNAVVQQSSQAQQQNDLAALIRQQQPAQSGNGNLLLQLLLSNGLHQQQQQQQQQQVAPANPANSNLSALLQRVFQQPETQPQPQADQSSVMALLELLMANRQQPNDTSGIAQQQPIMGDFDSGTGSRHLLQHSLTSLHQQQQRAHAAAAPSAASGSTGAQPHLPQQVVSAPRGQEGVGTMSRTAGAASLPAAGVKAPPPGSNSTVPLEDTPKKKPRGRSATFPRKLYEVLIDLEGKDGGSDIASFLMPHGRAFRIHKPAEFCRDIMPQYFQMSTYSSFQRQLNLYDFQRITEGPERDAYYHELFIRGDPTGVSRIRRNKVKGLTRAKQEERFKSYEMQKKGGNRNDHAGRRV